MPAKIIVLSEWKAEHPPMLRLWHAHCRCVSAWWSVALSPSPAYWTLVGVLDSIDVYY